MSSKEITTIKTSLIARRWLRTISAMTGEKHYEVMERLFKADVDRLLKRGTKSK